MYHYNTTPIKCLMICLRNLFQLSPTRHISHERHRNQLNLFPIGATPPPPSSSLPANLH